jgi:hypothetical protein
VRPALFIRDDESEGGTVALASTITVQDIANGYQMQRAKKKKKKKKKTIAHVCRA